MPAVLEQAKDVAYTSVGVNLLLTDAIVGHEVSSPEFMEEYAGTARKHATDALTKLRARTEEPAAKLAEQLPEQLGERMASGRNRAWDFIGIDAPKTKKVTVKAKTEATEDATS